MSLPFALRPARALALHRVAAQKASSSYGFRIRRRRSPFCIEINIFFLSPFLVPSALVFPSSQVLQSNLVHYPNVTHPHGLVTTILGLRIILDGSHFRNGSMRVKCLTSVLPMLTLNTDVYNNGRISYAQRRPPLDNREAMLLGT